MGKLPYYIAAVAGAVAVGAVVVGLARGSGALSVVGLIAWMVSLGAMGVDCRGLDDRYQFDGKDLKMRWHHYVIPGLLFFPVVWPLYLHARHSINKHEQQRMDEIRDLGSETA